MSNSPFFRATKEEQEQLTLHNLANRLRCFAGTDQAKREALCANAVAKGMSSAASPSPLLLAAGTTLGQKLLAAEGHLYLLSMRPVNAGSIASLWDQQAAIIQALQLFEAPQKITLLEEIFIELLRHPTDGLPPGIAGQSALAVPLYSLLRDPAHAIQNVLRLLLHNTIEAAGLLGSLRGRLIENVMTVSGITAESPKSRAVVLPTQLKGATTADVMENYL